MLHTWGFLCFGRRSAYTQNRSNSKQARFTLRRIRGSRTREIKKKWPNTLRCTSQKKKAYRLFLRHVLAVHRRLYNWHPGSLVAAGPRRWHSNYPRRSKYTKFGLRRSRLNKHFLEICTEPCRVSLPGHYIRRRNIGWTRVEGAQ